MKTSFQFTHLLNLAGGTSLGRVASAILLCASLTTAFAGSRGQRAIVNSSNTPTDNGTALSAAGAATQDTTVCRGGYAPVTVRIELTTTGSIDSAIVTRRIDGGEEETVGTLQPSDFAKGDRIKTAEFSDNLVLAAGSHTIEYCFTQSGSQGRPPKKVCTSLSVTVECDETSADCGGKGEFYFGNIANNPVLCNGNGTPKIPLHLKALAEGDILLTITGPNDFELSGFMRRAGESCIYQFLWDTRDGNHGGVGDYTFRATDAGGNVWVIERGLNCDAN